MIKGCFIDDQPDYFKDVKVDGTLIAKIHALTRNDQAAIEEAAYRKRIVDGTFNIDINSHALLVMRMLRSLESWELDRDITLDNVGKLPDKYFNPINKAILELEQQNKVTEGIEKN